MKTQLSNTVHFSLFVFCLSVFSLSTFIHAASLEQQLKTVFLGRLPSFITWPSAAKLDQSQFFEMCIIGTDNSFNALLDSLYNSKLIKEKPVVIHYLKNIEDITDCHLLFIGTSGRKKVTQILNLTKNKPIFTVGETRGFAEKNGMIQFYNRAQKIHFKANYQAAVDHGFIISFNFLSLEVVNVINR